MSYFSDEDEYEYRRYRGRDPSPAPVHYVQARPDRPRSRGYPNGMDPFLVPNVTERTMAITRVRERSRERRSPPTALSPPAHQHAAPVIIKQYNSNDHHSSDDESSLSSHHHHRGRGRSHSHVSIRSSHSRSRGGSDAYMTVERYELERKLEEQRRQLEALRMSSSAAAHTDNERYELARLKRELEELRIREERDAQRAEDAERWDLRKSKHELEDLRAREAREAREKADRERRTADYESYELQRSKKELQDLKTQQQREKEAMEKMREARTHAELRVAKEELDKSKSPENPHDWHRCQAAVIRHTSVRGMGMLTGSQSNLPRSKRPTRRGSARR